MAGSHGCRYFQYGSVRKMDVSFVGVRSPATKYLNEPGWETSSSSSSGSNCCSPNTEAVGVVVAGFKVTEVN